MPVEIRDEHKKLTEGFSSKQKEKLEFLISQNDQFLLDYGILEIAIEDKITEVSQKETEELFSAPANELGEVDIVIARLLISLEKHFKDVKKIYFETMSLDPSKPELTYLTKVVKTLI